MFCYLSPLKKYMKYICTIVLAAIALTPAAAYPCEFDQVTFDNDFAGASSDKMIESCQSNSQNKIEIVLKPENTPINNSPWYAFKLSSEEKKQVEVTIRVIDGDNRYPPKLSKDGQHWEGVEYVKDKEKLVFTVALSKQPVFIAAQEIITNQDYNEWVNRLAESSNTSQSVIGESVQGRPINALEVRENRQANEWLVILGRQHPPEITGALALFPFTENLLSDSSVAKSFRNRFNILIVPNLNPDGVQMGHWRHNVNGVDLNRDWKKFAQPEVRAVHEHINKLVQAGGKMAMAVDFHSTRRDIFYTMPNDFGMEQRYLVNNWLKAVDKQYKNFSVIQKPGNNPGLGVFKQYFADHYKVHAITYEMGDNTDRAFIHDFAIDAANQLMKTMMMDNQELQP